MPNAEHASAVELPADEAPLANMLDMGFLPVVSLL